MNPIVLTNAQLATIRDLVANAGAANGGIIIEGQDPTVGFPVRLTFTDYFGNLHTHSIDANGVLYE